MESIVIDGASLTPADVAAVARRDAPVELAAHARDAVRESRRRVEDIVDAGDPVYGVTTGFGDLVETRVSPDRVAELQTNLLRSHAAGAGPELDRELVRAMLVTRLNALAKGYSGVRPVVLEYLVTLLNERVHPVVRSRGSLGASGDLAPLAHLALVLIGEGEAIVERAAEESGDAGDDTNRNQEAAGDGRASRRVTGDQALEAVGLEPLRLRAKEGLALINGTQLTVGAAALVVVDGERLLRAADVAGALTTEVTMGTTATADPALMGVRPHEGQAASARNIKRLTSGSAVVESHRNCDRVQDAYAIRCLPQVHGAVRDAISHLRAGVETELDSATDNPLVFPRGAVDDRASGTDRGAVLSGGNFHGAPLAHRLDYAVGALTDLAAICERRVDRLINPNLQEPHLPPYLTADSGVESGLMIPQYTAAALLNECRTRGRAGTDTVPVSGGQEDHVSMSATAAFAARETVTDVRTVVAIELLTGAQAAEFLDEDLSLGEGTGAAYDLLREVTEPFVTDRPPAPDVDAVAELIAEGLLDRAIADAPVEELE
jgi:histidine ammonia-lyase